MKIVAYIEAHQADLIRKMLEHYSVWHDPPSRAPGPPSPSGPSQTPRQVPAPAPGLESGVTYETGTEFLEHARRENRAQPNLPWDA